MQWRKFPIVEVIIAAFGLWVAASVFGVLVHFASSKRPIDGLRTDDKNSLRDIVNAAQMYADEHRFYPRPEGVTRDALSTEADVRAVFGMLHRLDYLDDPAVSVSRADSGGRCSYTWRKRPATANADSKTLISGSMPPPLGEPLPLGGLLVAYKGGNVVFFGEEQLRDRTNADVRRAKAELVGWEDVGGWRLDEEGR